jgi:hypothetical protein
LKDAVNLTSDDVTDQESAALAELSALKAAGVGALARLLTVKSQFMARLIECERVGRREEIL